jgi:hypothetical protein
MARHWNPLLQKWRESSTRDKFSTIEERVKFFRHWYTADLKTYWHWQTSGRDYDAKALEVKKYLVEMMKLNGLISPKTYWKDVGLPPLELL